ncbi:NusG domain II-containing protein [Paenibacillus sp. TRM 82003]|nr:NusG domain II-containing protein [Paenibacillus sp. TRM 82003]
MIAIVAFVAAASLIFYFYNDKNAESYDGKTYARITVDGELFDEVELKEEEQRIEIRTDRGYNLLVASGGGIRMAEADCPDDLCLLMGEKRRVGETIVCLPNRVVVEIVGGGEGADTDAIAT